jgi:glucosamine-6-phosphate deaminase
MEVVILPDAGAVARLSADAVESVLRGRPSPVLGLATGSSPLGTYAELRRRHREEGLSFARATAFLLDEYVGLAAEHPQRYRAVIDAELAAHVDLRATAVHAPDTLADDVPAACAAYERAIAEAGGIDIQLLGIGSDGHLGFNEPGSSLASRTRIKTLTEQTRSDNARFFADPAEIPRHVLTQGLGTIHDARHLVLVALGERKADAVAAAVEGPVSASCPASGLQLHQHATVILDDAAAARLRLADYYREVYAGKPVWQHL